MSSAINRHRFERTAWKENRERETMHNPLSAGSYLCLSPPQNYLMTMPIYNNNVKNIDTVSNISPKIQTSYHPANYFCTKLLNN
jgi:hypothetical protein